MTDSEGLAVLLAENAIRRLVSAYCDAVNRRDAAAAGALFCADARIRIADSPPLSGREAITEGMVQTFARFVFMRQTCDTGLIDVSGDEARARLSVMEITRRPDEENLSLILGTYEDRYARGEGPWRFRDRCFSLQLRSIVPAAKLQQLPDPVPGFGFRT